MIRRSLILVFISLLVLNLIHATLQLTNNNSSNGSQVLASSKLQGLDQPTINFELVEIPDGLKNNLKEAISRYYGDFIQKENPFFVIGSFTQDGVWAFGSIGIAMKNYPPDWENHVWFLANLRNEEWIVTIEGSNTYFNLVDQSPEHFGLNVNMESSEEQTLMDNFKFPWDSSQSWCYTSSWHRSAWHGNYNRSLDFAPSGVPPSQQWFLSAGNGDEVQGLCDDNYQAFVNVTNSSLGDMGYGHLDSSTLPTNLIGNDINQGEQIGLPYDGTQGEGYYDIGSNWPYSSCTPSNNCNWVNRTGCCYLQYLTTCGAGTGAHSHWTLPSQSVTVDGWTVSPDGIWRKSGEPNRGVGSCFASTNSTDNTAPNTAHNFTGTAGDNGWYKSNVNVNLEADDYGGTGVATIHYRIGSGSWQTYSGSSVSFTVSQEGATTISYYAVDNAGNTESTQSATVRIDKSDPTSACVAYGSGSNGWYQGSATVQCTGSDSVSGLDTVWYALDGGSDTAYTAPFVVSGEGSHTVDYYAEDVAGNGQPNQQLTVGIDDTPPSVLTMTVNDGAITAYNITALVSSVVTDSLSGVAEMCVSYNQFDWTCQPYVDEFVFALPVLVQSDIPVYLYVIDAAGNQSAVVSDTIFLDPYPDLPGSTSYRLCSTAVTSAGGQRASGSFQLADTVGETHIEWLTSGNFQLQSGFMSRGTDCPLSPIPTVGYELVRTVIAASGETKTSPSFTLNSTFGEGVVQPCSTGSSFRLDAGFWSDCGAVLPTAVIPHTHYTTNTHFITWEHVSNVNSYEVYRSETPYFTPETATMVAVVSAPQTGYSTTLGIGDVNTNYYYLVVSRKTGVVQTAVSSTVGEFDFNLVAGD